MASPLIGLAAYIVWRGIYNIFFHPLRHFPGPTWAIASDFSKLWILRGKQQHRLGVAAHARYGPVVRAAPNLLAVSQAQLLPQIYHRRADKTDIFTQAILGDLAPPLEARDWREHAARRKRVASTFFQTNLRKLESDMDKCVLEWAAALDTRFAESGERLDFAGWSQWFAYDTICTLTLGKALGFVRSGCDVASLIKNFHSMAPYAALVYALPWLCAPVLRSGFLRKLVLPSKFGDQEATEKLMAFRNSLVQERASVESEQKATHKGVNNVLAANREDGSAIELEETGTDSFVLMVLASDTTAAFLCGFVQHVLETPGVHARLMAEVEDFKHRGALSSPVATFDEIQKMTYFVACYREVLRYQPPASILLSRLVGDQGLWLDGHYAPPGTEIGANPYVVNRDPAVFGNDADEFRPERWLQSEDQTQEMERYMLTWGYGTRVCLGKNIAMMETYKLLVHLFRKFRPSLADDKKQWTVQNLGLFVHRNMWLRIERRHVESG
ncbi:cytochrome P450 monooxygenase [Corynespora cassiicola Philippines]|uniref:Cytochrome P450 monooxygenase n=1 Tax=Corynespora cassiicola Philippines TaxID=1448308 RepID=A0A2T2N5B3_CORCC|nr:cytochrome P450 monooxygenase [Corynespora cassiicola Philippines]